MTMVNQTLVPRANAYSPLEGLGKEVNGLKNLLKAVYDFSVLGGAVGAINLVDDQGLPAVLPLGAVVTRVFAAAVTAVTSGGAATVSLLVF